MKATRKLIPALAMLLVSAVVMSSASFAWFTMNRQVTAQGMNVTVTAPNNLIIKDATLGDETYSGVTTLSASNIVLVPASTTSGKAGQIYQVADNQAVKPSDGSLYFEDTDGNAKTKLVAGNVASDGTEGAYYDFNYTIKSEGGQTVNVVVSEVAVTLTDASPSGTSALPVRIAVMVTTTEDGVHLFNPNNGTHHAAGQAITNIDGDGYPTRGTVTYTTPATTTADGNIIVTLTAEAPTANITIRVWYEGEDTDCVVSKGAKANFNIKVVLADVASLTPAP